MGGHVALMEREVASCTRKEQPEVSDSGKRLSAVEPGHVFVVKNECNVLTGENIWKNQVRY